MIQKISKTDAMLAKMKEEGNLTSLDKPEDLAAQAAMNEVMREVRRDYMRRDHASRKGAADTVLI